MIVAFYIIVLIFSVIIHEVSHGYIALMLGDETAKRAGRLTLNPLAHIDPFGSIIFPLLLALAGAPVFGWAKPVPYDSRFLKNPKKAAGLIALAGPASNFLLAIIFAIFTRLLLAFGPDTDMSAKLYLFFYLIIEVNIALAVFNLLPIAPLDGSGVLFSFLPRSFAPVEQFLRRYGFIILILLIVSGVSFLNPLITHIHAFLVGPSAPVL
jgi:Zn-dependent protease